MKKKILSLIMALCMVMTMPMPINAETVSRPSNSGGGGGFGTAVDAESCMIWKAAADSDDLLAGTMLADGLEVLFDTTYTEFTDEGGTPATRTIDGVEFTGYISHPEMNGGWSGTSINPDKSTALKYTATADGVLTVYLSNVGIGKIACLGRDGMDKASVEAAGIEGDGSDMAPSYNVVAGETYYVFVAGSKGRFCGVGFEPGAVVEETPVPTATPVVFPEPQYYLWEMSDAYSLCPADTELMTGLFTMFADTKGNGKYITSNDNGRMSDGKAEGTALKYKAWADGILTVSFTGLGADKTIYIVEEGGAQDAPIASVSNISADSKLDATISAEVLAGTTYYIYGAGTKACFNGAAFEPDDESATPAPTPVITDAPIFKPTDVEMAYTIYDGEYVAVELNQSVEGSLIAAAYDDNGAMYNNFIITQTNEEYTIYEMPIPSGATTKLMLWENFWSMRPLTSHEVIENTTGESVSLNAEYEADTNTVTYTVPTADVYSPMTVMIVAEEALDSDFIRDVDIYYIDQDYVLSGQARLNKSLPDGSYLVRVGFYKDGEYCISEEELTVIGCIFPIGEVENVEYEINGNRLDLTWDAAAGATHYAIYDEGGELEALVTEPSWSVVMPDEGTYVYTIKSAAVNGDEYIMSEGVTVEVEFRIEIYTEGDYSYTVNNGKATIIGCSKNISGEVEIPSTLGGYPVTAIALYAFDMCNNMTGVVIPDSVMSIGENAFTNCSFTSVKMSDNVTEIGEYAFALCRNLTDVELSAGIKSIGDSTFYMCESLKSITIPEGVESIGESAFEDCYALENVELPETLNSIGRFAFSGCALKNLELPGSLESIGEYALCLCRELETVVISDGTTAIGDGAFVYCDNLSSVTIPASVTAIGKAAFDGCDKMAVVYYGGSEEEWNAIEIAESNESLINATIYYNGATPTPNPGGDCGDALRWKIEDGTLTISGTGDMWDWYVGMAAPWYTYRNDIKNIVIESGVTSIGASAFSGCEYAVSATIPEGVVDIGDAAFFQCYRLTEVEIPDGVVTIGNSAFDLCDSLPRITIPASVESIGNYAFDGSVALEEAIILSRTVSFGEHVFSGFASNFTVKGYAGSTAEAYASERRYKFVALEEPSPEPTEEPTPEPTEEPTPEPTEEPTPEPTEEPTPEPTEEPTPEPTEEPSPEPTEEPTPEPSEWDYTIGEISLADGGVNVKFEGDREGVLVVASYDRDGRLMSISFKELEPGMQEAKLEIATAKAKMIYAYVWDSMTDMLALSEKKGMAMVVVEGTYEELNKPIK